MTLADEATNPILTDNTNRAIQGNVAMQVTKPGWKICTNGITAILWPNLQPSGSRNLELMQVAPSGGKIWN